MKEKLRCDINVTPLVDVCLVMLIIFMVVTPMIVERVLLPRTERPDEKKPKRSEQIRLVVGYPRGELWVFTNLDAWCRRRRNAEISLQPLAPPQAREAFFS